MARPTRKSLLATKRKAASTPRVTKRLRTDAERSQSVRTRRWEAELGTMANVALSLPSVVIDQASHIFPSIPIASSSQPERARTATERTRAFRERRRNVSSGVSAEFLSVSSSPSPQVRNVNDGILPVSISSPMEGFDIRRDDRYSQTWKRADLKFRQMFLENDFGYKCDVCDRLWFERDLKASDPTVASFLRQYFPEEDTVNFKLCSNCSKTCKSLKIPNMSKSNGYRYPPKPANLPDLDPLTERLISPRIPFMQIRRLRHDGCYGIVGQVINVPVDVDTMVKSLPRSLDDDRAFNVNLKKNLVHKSSYLSGFVKKRVIETWLRFLVDQPLYKHYNIRIDWTVFRNSIVGVTSGDPSEERIECLNSDEAPESELIHSMQQTMMFNEDQCLEMAPGQNRTPESLLLDKFAEELSFPSIYYGVGREIRSDDTNPVRSSAYTMCMSEIRRRDRRGATPHHVLYMAMKILRFRVRDGIQNMYRCLRSTENITRDMIEDREFVERLIDTNQAFLKTIPNSVQYWAARKRDVFAMIRQLGKPTAFLTLSANETRWSHLLRVLYRLSNQFKSFGDDIPENQIFEKLRSYQRAYLVAEDPVTCAIYFHKLVHVLMSILGTKQSHNPLGKYRVNDYFLRVEFQQRGSAHCHILLWLENDPHENLSEDMPHTIQMITDLCSVNKGDLKDPEMIKNQLHEHTFTCRKRGEKSCRFNIPYWPMYSTRVLIPLSKEDRRRELLKKQVDVVRVKLEEKTYNSIETFLGDIGCTHDQYLDLIRSALKRPSLLFKRDMMQIRVNTFNPWIASTLNSNMDLQIVLDPYSCAAYVVDYVNKSNRGMSHLHRELTKIHEANPEFDQAQLMTKVGLKILNSVEMSAQEAAWYLLRQPMSWASRTVIMIPTMRPHERYKARKRKSTMMKEGLPGDSTDIWTKSLIQKYEDRHPSLENITLAEFAAWYGSTRETNNMDDAMEPGEQEYAEYDDNLMSGTSKKRRKTCRILRYRNYDKNDILEWKREMVTLYVPFRNEMVDIIDRDKFLQVYETNQQLIMERRKEFEANIDIDVVLREIEAICLLNEQNVVPEQEDRTQHATRIQNDDDDLIELANSSSVTAIRPRSNVLSKEDYCILLRKTNPEQLELILEVIHRLHAVERKPIQIFLTGPAGSGKTFTLKALMETYNRYTSQHNSLNNAYIATATTGKAAVGINGVTVHSAFRLTISRQTNILSSDLLQTYRHLLRNVKCVIIDEISMCSTHLLHSINSRLQGMTGEYEVNFGGLDLFACGDLKQLPPVNATPVYCATRESLGGRAVLWQSLDYFPLRQVMRQSDINFSTTLTKIGCGEKLDAQEIEMIQSRFRTREWCNENLQNEVIRLFFNNKDVEHYNEGAIPTTPTTQINTASDRYTGYATEAEKREATGIVNRMKYQDTGNLPYSITLTEGYPYMLTMNADVEDGLVNGAIGKLRYVENCSAVNEDSSFRRVWLEFDSDFIGRLRRVKYGPHVRSKRGSLDERWVPIELRSANIKVKTTIKCNRQQFPLLPACALTIHKSQGGTFNQIVYDYNKNHKQQLVYVALTRVTSLDGLYLTNISDDFTFYHAQNSTAPMIRQIQDEYKRLETHRLPTITTELKDFLSSNGDDTIIIANVNVQSLPAHSADVTNDGLLSKADFLILTETWMHAASTPLILDGFQSVREQPCERRAGGVAIYRRESCSYPTEGTELLIRESQAETNEHTCDLTITRMNLGNNRKLILVAIYVHQQTRYHDLENFLKTSLRPYGNSCPQGDIGIPLVMMGDFNTNDRDRGQLALFLEEHYALKLQNNVDEATTLNNTCIDLTFSRGLTLKCKPYVSYFSYHRPVLNKIILNMSSIE